MLGATAGIHAHLWNTGYRHIPKIGPSFLALAIVASVMCLATLGAPGKLLGLVALLGSALEFATLMGLVITVHRGLFGFRDSYSSPYAHASIIVEIVGTVVLAGLVLDALISRRSRTATS
jgi:hypothetical protein